MNYLILAILLLLSITLAFADDSLNISKSSPPDNHIYSSSSCPSECCSYGDWSIKEDIPGYEKPDLNSNIIGNFKKGNIAYVRSGEIHAKPGKYVVKKLIKPDEFYCISYAEPGAKLGCKIEEGDILYPYVNLGEGYYILWFEGEFYRENLYAYHEQGEMLVKPIDVWWVYVTSPFGWSGWTNEINKFGHKGSCSGAYIPHVRVIYRSKKEKTRTSNEMKNYSKLLNTLSAIEGVKIIGNDYAFAYGNPRSMYIDIVLNNMYLMDIKKRTKAVQSLADTVYDVVSDLGIYEETKIEATCDYCEKINIKQ